MPRTRDLSSLGPLPEPLPEQDTEPNLFARPDEPGTCVCCGRSSFDTDDAFERGILFCLREVQSLYQERGLGHLEAEQLVTWLRSRIVPGAR